MSILIKALKQAERDHLARAAVATPAYASTAVLEPEPAPVPTAVPAQPASRGHGEALSLAPVELQERGGDFASTTVIDDARDDAQDDSESYHLANATAAMSGAEAAPIDETTEASAPVIATRAAPRVVPAVLQTTEKKAADTPARTSAPKPIPPMSELAPTAARRPGVEARTRGATPAYPASESTAGGDDLQAEQRKAARQLMAPAPAGKRFRRLAMGLTVVVLAGGALAAAYWQGLFGGLDGYAPFSASPLAPANRTLADRLQPSAPAAVDKTVRTHTHAAGSAAPPNAGGGARAIASAREGNDATATPHAAAKPSGFSRAAGAPEAAPPRPADAIHLRPPEATPERIRALLQDAYAGAGRGDSAGAGRIYQQVIEFDHNNGDAWIGLAALAANSGDATAANRDYRRALEIDPGDSVALGGLLGLQSGVDPQEAETRLRLLIVRDGAQPALQAALGKMLARQGRWLEAQETFYQAWVADPSQPDVAFNLAVTLERIRQPAPALSFYRRALDLAQTHSAHFNAAVAQERVAALTPKQP